jgi:GNAT superfamily N-acetyltransferase
MLTLRPATPGDAAEIAEIHLAARRTAMPWLAVVHSDEDTLAWVRDVVVPAHVVWVALAEGVVAGYMALRGDELEALYVRPEAQGAGAGTALLEKAVDLSPRRLRLWTFQRNASARAFYEQRGFFPVEFTDGAANEEREPDVRYEWSGSA